MGSAFDFPPFFDLHDWTASGGNVDSPTSSLSSFGELPPLPNCATSQSPTSTPSPISSSLDSFDSRSEASSFTSPDDRDHDQRRRFRCLQPGCDRRFTSQYTLKVHMDAHKAKPRVPLPCTLGCSERFSRRHDRLRHEVTQHGKICEFVCDECGRFFSSQKTLGNHKCPTARGKTRWVK